MKAPQFTLKNTEGEDITLPEHGKVVLYFYPKADTPGCTLESKTFTELYPEFIKKGTLVLGVSPDKPETNKKFKEKHDLPFDLLSDEDHAVAEAYGAWGPKKMYGRKYEGIKRTTFVIEDGQIENEHKHKPGKTEEEILSEL